VLFPCDCAMLGVGFRAVQASKTTPSFVDFIHILYY
jgi:hypothetical protein